MMTKPIVLIYHQDVICKTIFKNFKHDLIYSEQLYCLDQRMNFINFDGILQKNVSEVFTKEFYQGK
jgi:hypothetical protein